MKGIYKYTDLKTGEIVYVGKDSHIDKNQRHKEHLRPSQYDAQQINRVLQNNPDRYEYGVIWASNDCTTLKLNKMEILFGKIYNPKFNFGKFGKGGCNGHTEESKQKISESLKGENNPNYGKTGYWTGKKRQDISERMSGENHWNYGKCHSEETREKMSKNHADYSAENNPMWDKTHTDETKYKISESLNTSGYFRVSKMKCKNCKQGFTWRYSYPENGKYKYIVSVNINKLEQKVKAKGLPWKCIN